MPAARREPSAGHPRSKLFGVGFTCVIRDASSPIGATAVAARALSGETCAAGPAPSAARAGG